MPKLSPISAKKLIKILGKQGFEVVHQKGSHVRLKHSDEHSRGKGVAEKVLSASSKTDVLVRDDYPGYKNLKMNHQSCWRHLLGESKEASMSVIQTIRMRNQPLIPTFHNLLLKGSLGKTI